MLEEMIEIATRSDSIIMKAPITTEEGIKCVKSLKNNKAPGWDSITAEHIQYRGKKLMDALAFLFNSMVKLLHIPIFY